MGLHHVSATTSRKDSARKRILIISYAADIHARAVAYAIRQKGHTVEELFCPDFPTRVNISLRASDQHTSPVSLIASEGGGSDYAAQPFDAIWLRRFTKAWLPPSLHPGDQEVAGRQCDRALRDLLVALDGPAVFWVNHYEPEGTSLLKVHQLRKARDAGLSIPETLVSNDPKEIREFIQRHGGTVVHKLLQHVAWRVSDNHRDNLVCYTTPVTLDKLPWDEVLRLSPGIYQPLLPKAFEIRVACFGDYLMSLRIDSQSYERARLDWRAGQWHIGMEPYDLPKHAAEGIRRFLHSIGLVCASLDFVVTPNGGHIFLEANPQGQFLWMEDRAGLPVLNAMAEFLVAGRTDFEPGLGTPSVTWGEFQGLWEGGLKDTVCRHRLMNETIAVRD
jgi:hypothetical protein